MNTNERRGGEFIRFVCTCEGACLESKQNKPFPFLLVLIAAHVLIALVSGPVGGSRLH